MDLSKYIDKTIRVKFQGGREGEPGCSTPAHAAFLLREGEEWRDAFTY